jgi:hypothetical protein
MAVQHSDITLKRGSQAVSAVRTLWPVGSPYVDGGATAFDEVAGYVPVCRPQDVIHRKMSCLVVSGLQ